MKRALLLAALAALTVTAAVPAEAQRRAAPARADWVRNAVRTPEGGVRIGNPAAPVKLIEFGSITCPHCAEFARTGTQPLYAYVRSGRVSWEYRPYMIFPTDPGIFALLGCQAPGAFFDTVERLYANQRAWAYLAQSYMERNGEQLEGMALPARAAALVRASQVDRLFAARCMTQRQINACLANQANLVRVAETTRRATNSYDIPGTPTFYINGVQAQNVGVWADLEPHLIRAGARGR